MKRQLTLALLNVVLAGGVLQSFAEDQTQPTIRSLIGGFLFSSDQIYMAESEVRVPLLRREPLALSYRYHEVTPVLREGSQTQLLNSRNQLQLDYDLGEQFRLIGVGGYQHTALEDRPGSLSAYELGAGIGSPLRPELPRLEWSVVAGGYLSRQRLDSDWWADVHVTWRAFEFEERQMYETAIRPWLGLAADIESSNDGSRFRALYNIGPVLEVVSANGNRARFHARWYANDGNPFLETRDSAMLLGVEVSSSLDEDTLYDARDHRPVGWLPLIWGEYDIGYGGDRSLQQTALNVEIHDFKIGEQVITPVLWYESRQELQTGDFDNVSYSITFGVQTVVGLASPLSQGQPLVLGGEYLHRSAHALTPDADRVPVPPGKLEHDSVNLLRLRLQTLGWDLPYRNPDIYRAQTTWLNDFDWRITLGVGVHNSRDRGNPSAQLGLNWDIATVHGCVVYARGLGSIGNETPDWSGEVGVRRRKGKLFFRCESYGLESQMARGNTAVVGVGFVL